jgi:putative transposase
MITKDHKDLSLRQQCGLLGLNRSTLYYKPVLCDETELANEVHELWLEMPFYGYRRITAELSSRGYRVNHKRIQRIMREMNLQALYPRPKTSVSSSEHKIYPYLLKDLEVTRPNQVWATDITYIKMRKGFVYMVALIDIYSRYIVSWRLSTTLDTSFCLEMLEDALGLHGAPDILNTDQGCQFTSQGWVDRVTQAGIRVSMDGKGRWVDNVYIERFWRTLKHEHVLLHAFETPKEARVSIGGYIEVYNNRRRHQALDYKRPADVWKKQSKAQISLMDSLENALRFPPCPQALQPQLS